MKQLKLSTEACKSLYSEEMNKLTEALRRIEYEKQQLSGHLRILELASSDSKSSNLLLNKKLLLYKDNLSKLKNYVNEMLSPKIERIFEDSRPNCLSNHSF